MHCSGPAADRALLLLPLPAPPAPASRALDGVEKRRDLQPGCRARGGVCSAPRLLRALCVFHLTDSSGRASALPRTPRPLSRERGYILPPPHPTLQDQSYLRLALRESCSSPSAICRLFLSTTCKRRLLGGFWGTESKSTISALRSLPQAVPCWQGAAARSSQGMQQESGVPAPLHAARALETPGLPARLRHPPLAQGAGPGTSPRRQGAGARPAAARSHAGSFGSHSCVLALRPNLTLVC